MRADADVYVPMELREVTAQTLIAYTDGSCLGNKHVASSGLVAGWGAGVLMGASGQVDDPDDDGATIVRAARTGQSGKGLLLMVTAAERAKPRGSGCSGRPGVGSHCRQVCKQLANRSWKKVEGRHNGATCPGGTRPRTGAPGASTPLLWCHRRLICPSAGFAGSFGASVKLV